MACQWMGGENAVRWRIMLIGVLLAISMSNGNTVGRSLWSGREAENLGDRDSDATGCKDKSMDTHLKDELYLDLQL